MSNEAGNAQRRPYSKRVHNRVTNYSLIFIRSGEFSEDKNPSHQAIRQLEREPRLPLGVAHNYRSLPFHTLSARFATPS